MSLSAAGLLGKNLLRAYNNGKDIEAREGMALANARLGLVHGLAHPLGARYHIPHGLVCAILLPHVMRFNIALPQIRDKYANLAPAFGCANATGKDAIAFVEELNSKMNIPSVLSAAGLAEDDIPSIAHESLPSGSLKANPREATYEDIVSILRDNLA